MASVYCGETKMDLPSSDQHHLKAAEGWLGLGNWAEANGELDSISTEFRFSAQALDVRFRISEAAGQWKFAAEVASALCRLRPDTGLPCVYLGRALHGMGCTKEAVSFLVQAADRFPEQQD